MYTECDHRIWHTEKNIATHKTHNDDKNHSVRDNVDCRVGYVQNSVCVCVYVVFT